MKRGLTIEECVKKSEELISKQGNCLLLFDVCNSRQYNIKKLNVQLKLFMQKVNDKFEKYFPENDLATITRKEKGFYALLGDGAWAGINSPEVIPKIIKYQKENFPEFSLRWQIAKDGYDEGANLVK